MLPRTAVRAALAAVVVAGIAVTAPATADELGAGKQDTQTSPAGEAAPDSPAEPAAPAAPAEPGTPEADASHAVPPVPAAAPDAADVPAVPPAAEDDPAPRSGMRSFLVLTEPGNTSTVRNAITAGGDKVFSYYDAIGVVVVHSTDPDFASRTRPLTGVQKVGAARTSDVPQQAYDPPIPKPISQRPVNGPEQVRWDMANIGADKAWAINDGARKVTVGVLDTGIDDAHHELKDNFDPTRSASCAYGKLDTRAGSWRDIGSHGTHVAGTIAAAKNGTGMAGVAPGVRIASVRVAEQPTSLFFPENTVCALVYAGDQGFEVTNNSYYTDPWMFNCPADPDQEAISEAIRRAATYAERKGTLHVSAAGNASYDLAVKTTDDSSPNDSRPGTRPVTNDCLTVPAELPGVVTVGSLTSSNQRSDFSNYGTNKIDLAAPGTDVYSTVPGGGFETNSGTSMASPHVAGVAALLASVHPDASPAELREKLGVQADDLACPAMDARCVGSKEKNSYYGEGITDAEEAVLGGDDNEGPTCGGQLLGNEGFESGESVWKSTPDVIGSYHNHPAHSGGFVAWLNGYGRPNTDTLSQEVTLPPGCDATLTFYLRVHTDETTTSAQHDRLVLTVGTETISTVMASYSNLNGPSDYKQYSVDLSRFAGEKVIVKFTGTEDRAHQTSFFIDDTALTLG